MRRALIPLLLLALAVSAWLALRADPVTPAPPPPAAETEAAAAPPPRAADVRDRDATADADPRRTVADPGSRPRGTGTLTVHVVTNPDADPLPHVTVRVVARDGRDAPSTRRVAVTDDRGRARFADLDAGPWAVTTDRTSGADAELPVDVRAGAVTELTVRVPPGIDVAVHVVDAGGGPVPGAEVLHWPASGILDIAAWEPGEPIGHTDARGTLELRALRHLGGHGAWLVATHPALGTSPARMVPSPTSDDDRTPRVVELRLDPAGAWLDLRVVDTAGAPIPGATATARPVDHPSSESDPHGRVLPQAVRRARTTADGRARLGPLQHGNYRLQVVADGCAPHDERLRVDADTPAARDVVLGAAARVHGLVTGAAGAPLADADVTIQVETGGGSTRTGPDGRFAVGGLGAGPAAWRATHPRCATATGEFELVAGEDRELALALEPLAALHGRIVDSAGTGLGGWNVAAVADLPGAGDVQRRGVTETDGTFRLEVRGDRTYELVVQEPGQSFAARIEDLGPVRARTEPWIVTVPDHARATAFLEGFLLDGDGAPAIAGKRLSVTRDDDGRRRAWFGRNAAAPRTDPTTGEFRIGPLTPGTFTLWVARSDRTEFRFEDIELAPHRTTHVGALREPATGTLEVALECEPGLTPGDVMLQIESGDDTQILRVDRATWTAAHRLVPGTYEVVVYGDGFRWLRRSVEVLADETTAFRGVLRAAARVGLRFHMPDGEAGATFEVRDPHGEVVFDTELEPGVASEDWWPHLDRGRFEVEATGASGRRYTTAFTVESLEPSGQVVEIHVRPVR